MSTFLRVLAVIVWAGGFILGVYRGGSETVVVLIYMASALLSGSLLYAAGKHLSNQEEIIRLLLNMGHSSSEPKEVVQAAAEPAEPVVPECNPEPDPGVVPKQVGKKRNPWLIAFVLAASILVVAGIIIFTLKQAHESPTSEPEPEATIERTVEQAAELYENSSPSNAASAATRLLSKDNYSKTALEEELIKWYTAEDALYGASNCGADYNQCANNRAKELLAQGRYTKQELIEALRSEGYTSQECAYAAMNNGF